MTLEVIGAGFGRTGTMSMKVALEELGFGPCYHMSEVFTHPEHIELWRAAAQGKPVDWEQIFGVYLATLVMPGAKRMKHARRMIDELIWERDFEGKFEDQEHAIETFERHNEEVKQRVPVEKLLVYEVKEGWGPLCEFLGVEVPDKPFPHLNDTEVFRGRIRRIRVLTVATLTFAVSLAGLVLLCFRWRRRH